MTGKSAVVEDSVGFQFGVEAFSEIIFFKDQRAYDEFTSGGFELDATVQGVAITAGAQVQGGPPEPVPAPVPDPRPASRPKRNM